MRRFQKALSLMLALAIVIGATAVFPLTAYADGEPLPYTASGKCGVNEGSDVEWFAFSDNSMAIFGTGAIRDYTYDNVNRVSTAPWYGVDFSTISSTLFVTKIAVEYGVTRIGDYSFYIDDRYPYDPFVQINNIDIANTVTSIGKYAFYGQKMEEIVIPPGVTHIGENAFKSCDRLNKITYYGNPEHLTWDRDGDVDTEFSTTMECHILDDYEGLVTQLNARFAYKKIEFIADIDSPYTSEEEELDRNIAVYYGAANSHVFGGAAPYIIVGRFDGKKKSVTHGSNGFASCVYINGRYYVLTDSTTGELHEVITNGAGKMTGYQPAELEGITLKISHEYIGVNTVKIIYTLKNVSGEPLANVKVGGTGDIKIGADDKAAIHPLTENSEQVGFYMKSGKVFDECGDDFATLGFIGKNVKIDNSIETTENNTYPDAHYFYGKVDANTAGSAAGSKAVVLLPQRIFSMNTTAAGDAYGLSHDAGEFTAAEDSGMSYYWDESSLAAGEQKQYAVLFSVYGTNDDDDSASSMISDLSETFYTVTWEDEDGTLVKQVVKANDTPVYPSGIPVKESTAQYDYRFIGWTPDVSEATENTTYTALFEEIPRRFFKKHSISLDGDIGINYYIDVTAVDGLTVADVLSGTKTVKLEFERMDDTVEYQIMPADYDASSGLFKVKCTVCAAEMAYSVHTTAYIDDVKYAYEEDDFSVRDYGDVVLDETSAFSVAYKAENPERYAQLKDLVIKMLDYGAKAQAAFNTMTNDRADKNFSALGVSYSMQTVTSEMMDSAIEPKSDMRADTGDFGLAYEGSSVVFLSGTSLRHYYVVDDPLAFTDAIRDSASFAYHAKEDGLYFEKTDIPASKLDEPQVFLIDGKTYSYSVLNYCRSVLNSKLPREDKALAMATYWYNDSANRFFGD